MPAVSPKRELSLNFKGKFFTKEILAYVSQNSILFVDWNSFERIEYGSLANDKVMFDDQFYSGTMPLSHVRQAGEVEPHISDVVNQHCDLSGDYAESLPARFFIEGKCVELVLCGGNTFLCQICLLHQYGLHRTRDKINETCLFGFFHSVFRQSYLFWRDLYVLK